MSQNSSRPFPVTFLEGRDFLEHGASGGRLDRPINEGVTLSAIPDGSGTMRWEARTTGGTALRTFGLAFEPVQAEFGGPVVLPGDGFTFVCYEDEAQKRSWCIKVRTD